VERLRAEVEENMREEMKQRVRQDIKRQLLDKLVAANTVDDPGRAAGAGSPEPAGRHGAPDEPERPAGDRAELPPREPFEAPARFRVALGLLIGEIVRNNEIRVDPRQVQQRLQEIGEGYGDAEAVIKIYRSNPDLMSQVETAVLEDQVVDWLLERAKIEDKPVGFDEYMNKDKA
jgi:trigger factor